MKVTIAISIAGHAEPLYDQEPFSYSPGQVVDLHPDLARAWIMSGVAVALPAEIETTSLEVPETRAGTKKRL